mgnify:CR=1 FL=1
MGKMEAALHFLDLNNFEPICQIDDVIVFKDMDDIAFAKVSATKTLITEDDMDRRMTHDEYKQVMYQVVCEFDHVLEHPLRADTIVIYVIDKYKAIVQHGVNVGYK